MGDDKRIKHIMTPIEEYEKISSESRFCDALSILKRNYESAKTCQSGHFHKTLFVTDPAGKIIGKLSMYDVIRGLVPETAKETDFSEVREWIRSIHPKKLAEATAEIQERFGWLHSSFVELVKQEAHRKVKEIMSPVHPILKEEDKINQAIYLMFKGDVRQPLVMRQEAVVGVVDLMRIFSELLDIAGPECYVTWES